ncbi:DUF4185 domain-containing protein [Hamadaea sp. NPDC051192]|uniref:DUF4185 domain-containing protein n=1 Tax=Hamadaea sp. NPDC051192 TaxID=3154940 RepID=UPI0034386471
MTVLDPRTDKPFVLTGVGGLTEIGQVTGVPGGTDKYAVHGTDLGSMFSAGDTTYFVFGDTFGERTDGQTGAGGSFWRSNVLGYTTDRDPSDGVRLTGMVTDEIGLAKELLGSKKVDGDEMTVIPTYGFAVGKTFYLYYMSVRHWGDPGRWDANHAGLARSTDGGQNWTRLDAVTWPGDSGFIQVSVTHVLEDGVDQLYFWAIPAGRFGGVRLMRVPAAQVEQLSAYRYYAGAGSTGPIWAADRDQAVLVVDDTVGELSVAYNSYLDRWIMMYLREGDGVVLREGVTPWGPWSEPRTVVDAAGHPGLYAPFQYPVTSEATDDGGRRIYFNLSLWGPYNVFLYSIDLEKS